MDDDKSYDSSNEKTVEAAATTIIHIKKANK